MQLKSVCKLTIIVILILLISELYANESFDAVVTISSDKEEYISHEAILINIEINNYGKPGLRLNNNILEFFIITDSNNNRFSVNYHSYSDKSNEMNIGETVKMQVNVISYYGMINDDTGNFSTYFPPGTYSIQYIYRYPGYPPIESNIISVSVKEPIGDEKLALNFLRQGWAAQKEKDIEKAVDFYQKVYGKYPNSIYASTAINEEFIISKLIRPDITKMLKLSQKMLEEYPESEHAIRCMRAFYKIKEAKEGKNIAIEALNKIKTKSSSNKFNKRIECFIKEQNSMEIEDNE